METERHETALDGMDRAHGLLGINVIVIGALMGMGIKILPVPVVDEIALYAVCAGYLMRFGRYEVSHPVHNLLFLYLALLSILGLFMTGNINTVRMTCLAFGMLIFVNAKKSYAVNNALLVISAYAYLIMTILLPLLGNSLGLKVAWWQDWLWTGTAYSAFGIFFSGLIILYRTKEWSGILSTLLVGWSGVLNDSRLTMLYFYLLVLMVARKAFKSYLGGLMLFRLRRDLLLLTLGLAAILFANIGKFRNKEYDVKIVGAFTAATNTLKGGNAGSDQGRKDQDEAVFALMKRNPAHLVFGHGWLTHQREMLNYGISADSSMKIVRPTGFPAMIFDGGLILFALLSWCAFESGITGFRLAAEPGDRLILFLLPLLSIAALLITNLFDATLFWLTLVPGFYPNLLLARANHKI